MRLHLCGFFVSLLAVATIGCGEGGSKYPVARLSGKVTIDGTAPQTGDIIFTPLEVKNQAPPTSCKISGGVYSCSDVPKGKVSVRIIATRETGEMVTDYATPRPKIENLVPEKYNAGIPLTVEGDNASQNFELTK